MAFENPPLHLRSHFERIFEWLTHNASYQEMSAINKKDEKVFFEVIKQYVGSEEYCDEDWENRYYIGETDKTFENVEGNKHFIANIYSGMWNIGTQTEIDAIDKVKTKKWGKKHKEIHFEW
jgi:hypothetical protein